MMAGFQVLCALHRCRADRVFDNEHLMFVNGQMPAGMENNFCLHKQNFHAVSLYTLNSMDSRASKKLSMAATVRIKFSLFQGASNLSLNEDMSCRVAVSILKRSSILFKGTFPNTVTPNTPITYTAVADSSNQNEK